MTPKSIVKKAKHVIVRAFVNPWKNITRAKILIIGVLAHTGYGVLSFALNYSMAIEGPMSSIIYQSFRMILMGSICAPLTFWFLEKYKSRWLLALIQLIAVSLFFVDRTSPILNGFAFTVAYSPFLVLYSYRFAKNRTFDNQGNETALSSYLSMFCYSVGVFIGGAALQYDFYYTAVITGSLLGILGAVFLYFPITATNNMRKVWKLVGWHKPSSRISFFAGMFNVMVEGGLPIWMRAMGISPLAAGVNMSVRPIIGMLLTPIVGWLIQKGGFRAGQLGGIAMVTGWLVVALGYEYIWVLSWGLAILSIGMGLLNPMEMGRWFKKRSSSGIIAREMIYCTGRIPAYTAAILVSFFVPVVYPVLGLAISGLFIMNARPKRVGLGFKLKLPVLK
ncbi:MAG: hypothetical protein PHD48_03840 [Alphaproteobacteria bacterium]|nr:hypothetical protein [Alphaproteobacteria bacterium]